MEKDPVCGMLVDPRDAPERRLYQGTYYYFCSIGCAGKFSRAPASYVESEVEKTEVREGHDGPMGTKPILDPVCGMQVEPHQNELEYEGIHYAFCSVQCRVRFQANPHLYIGVPGHKAPKQQGKVVMKRRRFRTEVALLPQEIELLRHELASMMGVTEVSVNGDMVSVTYDLLQATAKQLEERMAEVGLKMGGSWKEKLRSAFVHYLEESAVDSLETRPPLIRGSHDPDRHG